MSAEVEITAYSASCDAQTYYGYDNACFLVAFFRNVRFFDVFRICFFIHFISELLFV